MTRRQAHAAQHERPEGPRPATPEELLVEKLSDAYAQKLCRYSLMGLCPLHLNQARAAVLRMLEAAEDLGYYLHKDRFAPGETIEDFYAAQQVTEVIAGARDGQADGTDSPAGEDAA